MNGDEIDDDERFDEGIEKWMLPDYSQDRVRKAPWNPGDDSHDGDDRQQHYRSGYKLPHGACAIYRDGLHAQRSTSPSTVSRLPRIAITSAILTPLSNSGS